MGNSRPHEVQHGDYGPGRADPTRRMPRPAYARRAGAAARRVALVAVMDGPDGVDSRRVDHHRGGDVGCGEKHIRASRTDDPERSCQSYSLVSVLLDIHDLPVGD